MKPFKNYSLLDMPGEVWVDIRHHVGKYKASNIGRIKSLKRDIKGGNGAVQHLADKIMHQCINSSGYCAISVSLTFSGKQTNLVHRLVAHAFLPNCKNYTDINHKNGIKTDNTVGNLEWCTKSQNLLHAVATMGHYSGVKSGKSKFTKRDVVNIFMSHGTHREIAKKYKVSHSVIGHIKRKQSYKEIVNGLN